MAVGVTFIYWTDVTSGDIVTVTFDALTASTPENTFDVTDHPVEEGPDLTDNIRTKAGSLSIEGIVSMVPNAEIDSDVALQTVEIAYPGPRQFSQRFTLDIPKPPLEISESGLLQAGVGAVKNLITGGGGAPVVTLIVQGDSPPVSRQAIMLQQNSPRNRVRDVYQKLLKAANDHTLVNVTTLHRDHFNMAITRIAAPRAQDLGTSAKFQIDFREIRTASTKTVEAPLPAEARGTVQQSKGVQTTKPADQPEKRESILHRALHPGG